jgi:hypothetical protein
MRELGKFAYIIGKMIQVFQILVYDKECKARASLFAQGGRVLKLDSLRRDRQLPATYKEKYTL